MYFIKMNFYLFLIVCAVLLLFFVFLVKRIFLSSASGSAIPLEDFEVLEIQVPKFETISPHVDSTSLAAENMFASLHGLLRESGSSEHFSFEIAASGDTGIKFYITAPASVIKFIEGQIYAQYPTALLRVVEDYAQEYPLNDFYEIDCLYLAKEQFFPIKTFRDFEVDPLSGVTSALAGMASGEQMWFQVLVRPTPDTWQKAGYGYIEAIKAGTSTRRFNLGTEVSDVFSAILKEGWAIISGVITDFFRGSQETYYQSGSRFPPQIRLSATQELEIKSIENKLHQMGFTTQMRILSSAASAEKAKSNLRSFVASFKQFCAAHTNSFLVKEIGGSKADLAQFQTRTLNEALSFVLTVDELASVYHLPSSVVGTPSISWLYSKKSEPPSTLPTSDCTYIGDTVFRNQRLRFGIKNGDDRLRHMYLIGKSGTGKSTLLETMITQDIKNGFGVGVLDPHGETIERVLERIPDARMDDVVVVDPSDYERPVGINLLEMSDPSQKNLMASALVAAIKQHFDYSWGPRLEYLLNYCILTLLEVPGTTLLGVTRLLEDDNYLRYILHFVKDPVVLKFWNTEYKGMKGNQKLVTEAIAPIQNKVNRFLASTTIRNILGQKHSTIDFWDIMNSGKVLLMNLSKGKVGADNANLLGALLVSRLQFMALQRARIPYEDRTPFYLYVDEFQNFATGSFEEILSESRKYKLGLYLTHQYTAQLPEEILKAVFGNVGTIAAFALGAPDARVLEHEFAPYFDENDIISLDRFQIYVKLMIDGMTSLPFSARILLPWDPDTSVIPKTPNKAAVLAKSREKYGVDRAYIEDKITKWIETRFDKGLAIAHEHHGADADKINF